MRDGAEVVVLSDRLASVSPATSHVPPLLAVGAVHHDLIRRGLRSRASLVSETAQCWSVHHFACLIGYGASAVHPYLAFETVRDLWERGRLTDGEPAAAPAPGAAGGDVASGPADLEEALRHYRVSAEERPAQDPLQDGHLTAGQLPRRAAVRGRRASARTSSSSGSPARRRASAA